MQYAGPSSAALDSCLDDLQEFGCNSTLLSNGSSYVPYKLTSSQVASVDLLAYLARKLERESLQLQLENKTLQLELRERQEELREAQKVADQFIANLDPDRA